MATQTLGKIRVVTSSQPIANAQLNAVKVAVNPGNTQRVQSITYVRDSIDWTDLNTTLAWAPANGVSVSLNGQLLVADVDYSISSNVER